MALYHVWAAKSRTTHISDYIADTLVGRERAMAALQYNYIKFIR